MAEFSDGLEQYLPISPAESAEIVKEGLVVLDTNVLLDSYRFTTTSRDDLLAVLELVGERLWIPWQVRLEFHRDRPSVLATRRSAYDDISKDISTLSGSLASLQDKIRQLANRVRLADADRDALLGLASSSLGQITSKIDELKEQHGLTTVTHWDDPILARLQELFKNRVGGEPEEPQLKEDKEEGNRRIKALIPPGFKDQSKSDPTGDYLFWIQSLREAKSRQMPLLVVTGEQKDDWIWRPGHESLGGLPQLLLEARTVIGRRAIIMKTSTFLHHARDVLNTKVRDETIREAIESENSYDRIQAARATAPDVLNDPPTEYPLELSHYQQREIVVDRLFAIETMRDELTHDLESYSEEWPAEQTEKARLDLDKLRAQYAFNIDVVDVLTDRRRPDSFPKKTRDRISAELLRVLDLANLELEARSENFSDPGTFVSRDGIPLLHGMVVEHPIFGVGRVARLRMKNDRLGGIDQALVYFTDGLAWVGAATLARPDASTNQARSRATSL